MPDKQEVDEPLCMRIRHTLYCITNFESFPFQVAGFFVEGKFGRPKERR